MLAICVCCTFEITRIRIFLASCVIKIYHRINTCTKEINYIVEEPRQLFLLSSRKFQNEFLFYQSYFLLFTRSVCFI